MSLKNTHTKNDLLWPSLYLRVLLRKNRNTAKYKWISYIYHALQDLNPRHQVLETSVLPTELKALHFPIYSVSGDEVHIKSQHLTRWCTEKPANIRPCKWQQRAYALCRQESHEQGSSIISWKKKPPTLINGMRWKLAKQTQATKRTMGWLVKRLRLVQKLRMPQAVLQVVEIPWSSFTRWNNVHADFLNVCVCYMHVHHLRYAGHLCDS